jgi:hypothetical protein
MTTTVIAHASNRVPLWLKFFYTAFMIVLVPVYWHYYGPTNFLIFLRRRAVPHPRRPLARQPLLISMCAVGILAPQALWVLDFVLNFFGVSLIGMTDYMFKHEKLAVPARTVAVSRLAAVSAGLSRLAARLRPPRLSGLDVLSWALILICFFFMPPPDPNAGLTPVNINYVWGPQ